MFLYRSHLGEHYTEEIELSYEELYCEDCNDSDNFIGEFNNEEELLDILNNNPYMYTKKERKKIRNMIYPPSNKLPKYTLNEIYEGMIINSVKQLSEIEKTWIVLYTIKKTYKIEFICQKLENLPYAKFLNQNPIVIYNDKTEVNQFDNIETNNHGVNKKIKTKILSEEEMRNIGFTDYNKDNWFFSRLIKIPKESKYSQAEIGFSISIPKDGSEIRIDVLDEDFCQPYDYQSMMERNITEGLPRLVKNQVEYWMKYLQDSNVLTGHVYGDYI